MKINRRIIKSFCVFTLSLWTISSWAVVENPPTNATSVAEKKPAASKGWQIQHWKTPSGTPVYFIENHILPMVDIQVVFRAGGAYDGQQFGLSNLTNLLLNQGTKQASVDQIAEQWDMAGAAYNASVSRDMAVVGMRSLTYPKQFSLALSTLKDILANPTFPMDAFSRTQKQLEQLLKHQEQKPDLVGAKLFYKTLYGQHPYAHPVLGDSASLAALKQEDVQKFYQRYYTADNAIITIVGNFSLEEAKKVSSELTAPLNRGKPAETLPSVIKNEAYAQHVAFPSNQTHLLMGQLLLSRTDPDYYPLTVANYILGGGMTSRLFRNVRGEQGLAYNVSSGFTPTQEEGPFYIRLQTENSQKQKAVDLVKKIILEFMAQGPSKEELAAAQQYLVQNFVLQLSSNQATSAALTEIAFYGLPLDYLTTYQDKLKSVTNEQIQKALKKHLSPDRFVLITVGKDA